MSSLRGHIMEPLAPLLGIAIAAAIIMIVAGLSFVGASVSTGLVAAVNIIASFIVIVGVAVVVRILTKVL